MTAPCLADSATTSGRAALDVAAALGDRLWGVRLDTSESLVDRSLVGELGDFKPTGVNERLVWKVREALDAAGHERVRIVVSGGFTVDKISAFEEAGGPGGADGGGSAPVWGAERLHPEHRRD